MDSVKRMTNEELVKQFEGYARLSFENNVDVEMSRLRAELLHRLRSGSHVGTA